MNDDYDNHDSVLPKSPVQGLIPTLNNTGWMTEKMDAYSQQFVAVAGTVEGQVLDIGCAYGIATLAALANGARVLACDIEQRHLDILQKRIPAAARDRCELQSGALPAINFPPASFEAILAARVLHFLSGPDIETTVAKMVVWLKPGGQLFLVADSPYTGPWARHADEYERRKRDGDPWPGLFTDYASFLSTGTDPTQHPDFINPLDPDILARVCAAADLEIIAQDFLSSATRYANGRDHAGIIARKPLAT